jgi:hypothetical protein
LFDNVAAGGFEFAQNAACSREESLADFGEANGAAEAVEKTGAELIF